MSYEVDAEVYHGAFGLGRVKAVEGDRHVVSFIQVGTRKVLTAQLVPGTIEGIASKLAERRAGGAPQQRKAPAPLAGPLPILNLASLAGKPVPQREWHVEDMLPAYTVTLLGGDGGTGKSLLAAQLAAATVARMNWIGRPVTSGPCLYISAEDDHDELWRRFATIVEQAGEDLTALDRLEVVPMAGEDALLVAPEGKSNILKRTPLFGSVEARIAAAAPVLVILDTLADLFGGEENQRAQVRQFVGMLRGLAIRYRTTVLLLAHPSLSGMASGSGTSGSTAWSNSVRSRLYLDRVSVLEGGKPYEPDPDLRVLRTMKANYGRTGGTIRVKWEHGIFRPVDAGPVGSMAAMAAEHQADTLFLDLVAAFNAEGRPVGPAPGPNYAPSAFSADSRAAGVTKRGFADAMSRLFQSRRIVVERVGPPSRQVSRITLAGLE
jgi:RecA-family ATPase